MGMAPAPTGGTKAPTAGPTGTAAGMVAMGLAYSAPGATLGTAPISGTA